MSDRVGVQGPAFVGGDPSEDIDGPRAGISAKLAHARLRLVAPAEGLPCARDRLRGLVTGAGKSRAGNQRLANFRVRQFGGRAVRPLADPPLAATQIVAPSRLRIEGSLGRSPTVLRCSRWPQNDDSGLYIHSVARESADMLDF